MSFSLQKGFLHLFSGSILGRAISFLLNIVLSRFLGPSSLGLYALALNAIQSFDLFTKLGLDYGLSLELTSNHKDTSCSDVSDIEIKVVNQSLSLIIISSLVHGLVLSDAFAITFTYNVIPSTTDSSHGLP